MLAGLLWKTIKTYFLSEQNYDPTILWSYDCLKQRNSQVGEASFKSCF